MSIVIWRKIEEEKKVWSELLEHRDWENLVRKMAIRISTKRFLNFFFLVLVNFPLALTGQILKSTDHSNPIGGAPSNSRDASQEQDTWTPEQTAAEQSRLTQEKLAEAAVKKLARDVAAAERAEEAGCTSTYQFFEDFFVSLKTPINPNQRNADQQQNNQNPNPNPSNSFEIRFNLSTCCSACKFGGSN
ncbi:hypothetical protein DFH09DRAFT_1068989 [Mycena vulgaris]|nr:hypothetical protein DFH09DRAFT_1068989 [Mycena vulgaris]